METHTKIFFFFLTYGEKNRGKKITHIKYFFNYIVDEKGTSRNKTKKMVFLIFILFYFGFFDQKSDQKRKKRFLGFVVVLSSQYFFKRGEKGGKIIKKRLKTT